jgi:methyl-accepting chemotaxis protein
LSEKIERSANRSSDQLSETEMLASSTTELSASLSDVARGAQQSAESAREANEATAQATQALANTRLTVESLAKTLVEIQQKAHDMKSHNQKVNSVIEVIRGIAEQTNLLALNAAIEAARAGEQGRGFAVVADEVRNLAQKTQASTMEINAIIEQLQNNTDQVVSAMDAGVSRSHHSVETANDANQLLQTAITAVQAISSRSEEIAHSVEQQSQVTDEIANSSVKIAGDGKLNATDFSDCLQLNRDVNENLEALRELLGQFKLKQ